MERMCRNCEEDKAPPDRMFNVENNFRTFANKMEDVVIPELA